MFGEHKSIYVINDIDAIANKYNELCELTYEDPEYILPFEDILDPQEYGTDCYCRIDLDSSFEWDYVLKHSPSDEWYHYYQRRAKFLDYIRDNIPSGITEIFVKVSY